MAVFVGRGKGVHVEVGCWTGVFAGNGVGLGNAGALVIITTLIIAVLIFAALIVATLIIAALIVATLIIADTAIVAWLNCLGWDSRCGWCIRYKLCCRRAKRRNPCCGTWLAVLVENILWVALVVAKAEGEVDGVGADVTVASTVVVELSKAVEFSSAVATVNVASGVGVEVKVGTGLTALLLTVLTVLPSSIQVRVSKK